MIGKHWRTTGGLSLKQMMAEQLSRQFRTVRFKGSTMIESDGMWLHLTSDNFSEACYRVFGQGVAKTKISDLEHLFRTSSPDMSHMEQYISFGDKVWDTKKADWTDKVPAEDCIYRVSFDDIQKPSAKSNILNKEGRLKFVMDLACGDEGVYDDIMQSVAPIIMHKKPTGVIWYLGGGANGKSTLVHLLYLIFGPYFTELTVKQLEDERDTPQINGKLANVCKESSEGFVEDTRTYKSIGTHENFSVHKFHSQDMVEIEGNVHHIFSANNIPTFGDKSYGARRRTLVIPFNNSFKPDETFEDKTFTKEFINAFIAEMLDYAQQLKERNYEYEFSDVTTRMKEKYDTEANTAQTYADELIKQKFFGFANFSVLRTDYENWCKDAGYNPSSINVLRRAINEKEFSRRTTRASDGSTLKLYIFDKVATADLLLSKDRYGMYYLADGENHIDDIEEEEQEELLKDWSEKERNDDAGNALDGF